MVKKVIEKNIEENTGNNETSNEVIENNELIVIANESNEFEGLSDKLCSDKIIVDLVRNSEKLTEGKYGDLLVA